ncbi:MAG: HAD hydrolase family protein, partial [Erysipelotrichaceae bacterium]|nr:HAD hydrolase family protein [Erysipelotrichaceae bacterium]
MNTDEIKAAIFDIDDTLFDMKSKTFIPSAIIALKKLQENGIKVILATGRPPQTATAIYEQGVHPDYIICTNGHIIL